MEGQIFSKFIKGVRARMLYQNKNWLSIICGETGSGKSYSALSLAKLIGGQVFVVFNPVEFLKLLNSGKLSKGDCVIFDEAGVGMSSRDWYSVQNKLLGSVLQTFRNMNVSVIFTTPNLSFIDVQARKLFHCYLETSYLDFEKEEAWLKVYNIQVNSRLDKIYYKKPKFQDENGRVITMSHLVLNKPDDKIVEYYEKKKSAYTQELNRNALAELTGENKPKPKEAVNLKEVQAKVLKNKTKYLKEYNQRKFIDCEMLRDDFGVSIAQSKSIKRAVENKIFTHTERGT